MVLPELFANTLVPGQVSSFAVLAAPVNTAPAAGTVETWTFSDAPPAALCQPGQFRFLVGNELCLDVTGDVGTSRQVERGIEGSTPATHPAGATLYHLLTAGAISALLNQPPEPPALAPVFLTMPELS